MLAEQEGYGENRSASPNPASGAEYNTTHPVMLIKVKGTDGRTDRQTFYLNVEPVSEARSCIQCRWQIQTWQLFSALEGF